jgi:hypothetical protein
MWHALIEEDEEGNDCVYMQDGDNEASKELHDMVESDIKEKPDMVAHLQDYLDEAKDICDERNAEADD